MLDLTTCAACGMTGTPGQAGLPTCGCFVTSRLRPPVPLPHIAASAASAGAVPSTDAPVFASPPAELWIEKATALAPRAGDTGRGWGIRDSVQPSLAAGDASAAAAAPPSPVAPRRWPAPEVTTTVLPSPKRSGGRLAVILSLVLSSAAVVSVVLLTGWTGGGFSSVGPLVSQPVRIAGLTRIDTPDIEKANQAFQATYGSQSVRVVSSVYGRAGVPQLILVTAQGSGAVRSTSQLVASIDASGTPFAVSPTTARDAGQEYVCGRVAGQSAGAGGVLCAWTDRDVNGFVLSAGSRDVPATLRLAIQAKAAAEH